MGQGSKRRVVRLCRVSSASVHVFMELITYIAAWEFVIHSPFTTVHSNRAHLCTLTWYAYAHMAVDLVVLASLCIAVHSGMSAVLPLLYACT